MYILQSCQSSINTVYYLGIEEYIQFQVFLLK